MLRSAAQLLDTLPCLLACSCRVESSKGRQACWYGWCSFKVKPTRACFLIFRLGHEQIHL